MNKYFEVTVEVVIGQSKSGKDKKNKEIYLVESSGVTEAESLVIRNFVDAKVSLDYKVISAKESKIVQVI
jgi:hypothetical protein